MVKHTPQYERIIQKKKKKNCLEGVDELQFTEDKFQKWCKQNNYDPAQKSRPKFLIQCDICQKIFNEKTFYQDQQRHLLKKKVQQQFKKTNNQYICEVEYCNFQPQPQRQLLVDHLFKHNQQQLQSINIDPSVRFQLIKIQLQIIFKGEMLQVYLEQQSLQQKKQKNNIFKQFQKQLIEQEVLGVFDENEIQIDTTILKLQEEYDEDYQSQMNNDEQLQIMTKNMYPELEAFIKTALQKNILIEQSSKDDLYYQSIKITQEEYKIDQFINNKRLLEQVWNKFKYLNYFKELNLDQQNQIVAIKINEDSLTLMSRAFNCNLRYLLNNRHNEHQLKLAMLGLIQGVKQLHELKIVHRDIKPENILISTEPNFQVFIGNYNYCIRSKDVSGSRPNTKNPYINTKLGINENSKFWDIYSLSLILFECLVGRDRFLALNHRGPDFTEQFLKLMADDDIDIQFNEMMCRVLVDYDKTVTVNELYQVFYELIT